MLLGLSPFFLQNNPKKSIPKQYLESVFTMNRQISIFIISRDAVSSYLYDSHY